MQTAALNKQQVINPVINKRIIKSNNDSQKELFLQSHELGNKSIMDYFGINEQLYWYDVEHWMPSAYEWINNKTIVFKKIDISELKDGDRVLLINVKNGFIIPRHVIFDGKKLVYKETESDSLSLKSKRYELLGLIISK